MQRAITFIAGVIVGSAVVGITAQAGSSGGWIKAVNEAMYTHGGLRVREIHPVAGCTGLDCNEQLRVHVRPAIKKTEVIDIAPRALDGKPIPDPDFQAVLEPVADPERPGAIRLYMHHPDDVVIVGPDGKRAELCAPAGGSL